MPTPYRKPTKPINLGDDIPKYNPAPKLDIGVKNVNRGTRTALIAGVVFFFIVAVAGASAAVVLTTGAESVVSPPETILTEVPTLSPSISPTTLSPTMTPTAFPTRSPVVPTTPGPTQSPTTLADCGFAVDPTCGCNKVISAQNDIMIILDESGSVTLANYNLVVGFFRDFVENANFTMGPFATRIAVMEFSTLVNNRLNYDEYPTKQAFLDNFESDLAFGGGWTNTPQALIEANEMIFDVPVNQIRNGSQTIILFVTDGIPEIDPADTIGDHVAELKALAEDMEAAGQQFTFIFIPIGASVLGSFDGDNGLTEGVDFLTLPAADFNQLESVLNDDLSIPLGPCITPPPSAT